MSTFNTPAQYVPTLPQYVSITAYIYMHGAGVNHSGTNTLNYLSFW